MNYLNLRQSSLRSETFKGQEPIDRATWLMLQHYCADQENGGCIPDCKGWGDRKWQQVVAVMKSEVMRGCPLWRWEGEDLIVWEYPVEQEGALRKQKTLSEMRREAGREGGKKSAETRQKTRQKTPEKTVLGRESKNCKQTSKNGEANIQQHNEAKTVGSIEPGKTKQNLKQIGSKPQFGLKQNLNPVREGKEKERKEKEDKKENLSDERNEANAPSRDEVREYFSSQDRPEDSADRFFDHHASNDWEHNGSPIRGWRKMADGWKDGPPQSLTLENGAPLPRKCLPITEIIRDDEAEQEWIGGKPRRHWLRSLGLIEDLGPAGGVGDGG